MSDNLMSPVIGSVYLHVSNSGLNVTVMNERGPTLLLESHSFGNLNHSLKVYTTINGLRELRDLLTKALDVEFTDPYCCAAEAVVKKCDSGPARREQRTSDRGECGSGCWCCGACGD